MAKLTVKQLKKMIRETVREQISGLPDVGATQKRTRDVGAPGKEEGNPWVKGGFNLNQLVDALKEEEDEGQKEQIKQAIKAKLKAAGW